MSLNPSTVNHGSAAGTPINGDQSRLDHSVSVKVQLSSNYTIAHNAGDATRPGMTGCTAASLDYPRTVTSGTVLTLLAHEAAALVAAGKASYV